MNKNKASVFVFLFLNILGIFCASNLHAAASKEITLKMTILPINDSFEAKSEALEGTVKANADGSFSAEKIELSLTTLKSGMDLRDAHMANKYFKAKEFPKAIIKNVTAKNGIFEGMLALKGVEKKIQGTYKVKDKNLNADFLVKMSEFQIEEPSFMGLHVKDEVNIAVNLTVE